MKYLLKIAPFTLFRFHHEAISFRTNAFELIKMEKIAMEVVTKIMCKLC